MEMAYRVAPTAQANRAQDMETTTKIVHVRGVRMELQLTEEDRKAIRRSKQMLLMAVAAVTAAVLLAPADGFEPRAGTESSSAAAAPASSAPSMEPTTLVGDAFSAEPKALAAGFTESAADRLAAGTDYPVARFAETTHDLGGLPNR
jgi:hypothetical protein